MKDQDQFCPRQSGIPDQNLRKFKACFTHASERTIHGCVYAESVGAAYNMLIPPKGYSRSVLEIGREQACYYDPVFSQYVTLNPQPFAMRDKASMDTGVKCPACGAVHKVSINVGRTLADVKRDLQSIADHPEYSLERVRAEICGILEERL